MNWAAWLYIALMVAFLCAIVCSDYEHFVENDEPAPKPETEPDEHSVPDNWGHP